MFVEKKNTFKYISMYFLFFPFRSVEKYMSAQATQSESLYALGSKPFSRLLESPSGFVTTNPV